MTEWLGSLVIPVARTFCVHRLPCALLCHFSCHEPVQILHSASSPLLRAGCVSARNFQDAFCSGRVLPQKLDGDRSARPGTPPLSAFVARSLTVASAPAQEAAPTPGKRLQVDRIRVKDSFDAFICNSVFICGSIIVGREAVVGSNIVIGRETVIGGNIAIGGGTVIGSNIISGNTAVVGADIVVGVEVYSSGASCFVCE